MSTHASDRSLILASFFSFFFFSFLLSLFLIGLLSTMAPHYGSPNPDQVLALSSTVVGVGPGGNTSMVA
jgi:hypothetical protein